MLCIQAERLLDEDVLARLQRFTDEPCVQVVAHDHEDRVDRGIVKQQAVVRAGLLNTELGCRVTRRGRIEVSYIGETEEALREKGIEIIVGRGQYASNPRGQIIGDTGGMLKLIFDADSMVVLGVHIVGSSASELIHIGQTVMALSGTAEFFIDTVFNFPTLAEAYKVAAYNGLNKLSHVCAGGGSKAA